MTQAIKDIAETALSSVLDPESGQDIVSLGWVHDLRITESVISCVLEIDPAQAAQLEPVRAATEAALKALPGISVARVVMTAERTERSSPERQSSNPPPRRPSHAAEAQPLKPTSQDLAHIRYLVPVASGKGGVGKSTVSANLAVSLAEQGVRVGLLDADVYGPSQPRMMGRSERPASRDGQMIIPLEAHGVRFMSLGLMVREGEAIVWRGPMLMSALQQMLFQVDWGTLDVLIVDLPPGTGDVQLTLCQKAEIAGALIVSTPQDVALIDARKAIDMFAKMKIPILGIIENMSGFECGNCGMVHYPFGQGGGEEMAADLQIPCLGTIPLELNVRLSGDDGTPAVLTQPDSLASKAFASLAERVMAALESRT